MRALIAFLLLCLTSSAWSQEEQPAPILTGYVTRVASGSDFDVNAIHILCGPDTNVEAPSGDSYYPGCPQTPPILGQRVDVYGHNKKKLNAIAATRLDFKPLPHDGISGYAVIDAVAAASSGAPGTIQIRADGYPILITPQTTVAFNPPLNSSADIMTNVWVDYDAKPGPGGTFVARSAKFSQNFITDREDAMRAKTEYDPAVVPIDAKLNPVALAVGVGPDPKRIPPWPNQEMQDRLNAIGQKLIPTWQQRLAPDDPSRINFRFQLTDGKRWPWVLTLPSGIILVPHQVVERMQNDSQLAEILADAIACALEKQTYRMRVANTAITVGAVASWAQFVPVIGGPAALIGLGSGTSQLVLVRKEEHQSGRVSLDLLHDAGYDVTQAPVAWWLLVPRKPKPLSSIQPPDRTVYLYRTLSEIWQSPTASSRLSTHNSLTTHN
jgi:hypothetical protein